MSTARRSGLNRWNPAGCPSPKMLSPPKKNDYILEPLSFLALGTGNMLYGAVMPAKGFRMVLSSTSCAHKKAHIGPRSLPDHLVLIGARTGVLRELEIPEIFYFFSNSLLEKVRQ